MLAGLTYEKVWSDQTSGFTEDEVLNLSPIQWSLYLNYLGFEVGRIYAEEPLLSMVPSLPPGIRYLSASGRDENHPDYDETWDPKQNTHSIVIDESGIVFDPGEEAPGSRPLSYYQTYPMKLLFAASVEDRRTMK